MDSPYMHMAADFARAAAGQTAQLRNVSTPIVQDMRSTARALGVIDLLLQAERDVYTRSGACADAIRDALLRLGATNEELLKNLETEAF